MSARKQLIILIKTCAMRAVAIYEQCTRSGNRGESESAAACEIRRLPRSEIRDGTSDKIGHLELESLDLSPCIVVSFQYLMAKERIEGSLLEDCNTI